MRVLVLAFLATIATAQSVSALTIRDIIELSRSGLKDEVLLALIEVAGGVYATDTDTLKTLKEAGVSDRVMVALIRSGREKQEQPPQVAAAEEPPAPPAPVVVIEHRDSPPQQVVVPVPVYVPVYPNRIRGRRDAHSPVVQTYVPFQSGQPAMRPVEEPKPPVYWGFGGKLRPDAWGQPETDKPAAVDGEKRRR